MQLFDDCECDGLIVFQNNPAENLLKAEGTHKWRTATPGEKNATVVLQVSLSLLKAAHTFCVSVLCVHVVFNDKHVLNLMCMRVCIYVYPRSR